jgi:thioredoxin-like negative regulator of GroEL
MNSLYKKYTSVHRNSKRDVVIAKMDGGENRLTAMRYNIRMYPTLLLFRPGDTTFPIKYEGHRDVKSIEMFIDSFRPKFQKANVKDLDDEDVSRVCKGEVDRALMVYERELRADGLLLTRDKMKYYKRLEKRIETLPMNWIDWIH